LGNSLAALGRHWEASQKFAAAIGIDPDYAFAYNGWGYSLGALGRTDEAVEKFEAAIEIDPTYRLAFDNWAALLGQYVGDAGEEDCARLAVAVPRLAAHARDADWAAALDRFKEPQAACAGPAGRSAAQ
jgi:tetratricopeptide (TPR) repeat protein